MNAFVEHHKNSIQFGYRCFDRLLLNGLIQPFQQPERVPGFFNAYRDGKRVIRKTLTDIADQFQYWLKNRSEKWGAPILEPPDGDGDESRRDRLLDTYFLNAKPNQVVAIVKAREPARILLAIGRMRAGGGCSCACAPTFRFPRGSVSISITGWRFGCGKGYSSCVAFLKLFEKIYAPLTAGLLQPFRGDRVLAEEKRCELDRIYTCSPVGAVR